MRLDICNARHRPGARLPRRGRRRAARRPLANRALPPAARPPPTLPTALQASRAAPGAAPRSAVVAAAKKKGFGGKGGDAAKPADIKVGERREEEEAGASEREG